MNSKKNGRRRDPWCPHCRGHHSESCPSKTPVVLSKEKAEKIVQEVLNVFGPENVEITREVFSS